MGEGPKLGCAVIGAGRIGSIHAENLSQLPGTALVAIAEPVEKIGRPLAERLGVAYVADYRELLGRKDVDAVAICTPATTHVEVIVDAARAKKQIFCEKPIDFDLERIDRALAAVKEAGVHFQVGFNRRFDRDVRLLRDAIEQRTIGDVQVVRITSRDPVPPPIGYIATSGGLFLDMTIHDFDMARFLVGDLVESVFAMGSVLVDPAIGAAGDVDTAVITLQFKSGAIATIDNSRKAVYGYDQRIEVLGSAGMATMGNLPGHTCVVHTASGSAGANPGPTQFGRYFDSYRTEMAAFWETYRNVVPQPPSDDGRMATLLGLAAKRSHEERRVVRLDEAF